MTEKQESSYKGHTLTQEDGRVTVTRYGREVIRANTETEAKRKIRERLNDDDT